MLCIFYKIIKNKIKLTKSLSGGISFVFDIMYKGIYMLTENP
jgi:hypothetical protein